ncbi:hypothetical protein [Streptomyces sp. HC307]|uniref:hypothetical protein n=1 Tax=Streptomyces flavusporus TaxID=3385496 RepID=UPI003916F76B
MAAVWNERATEQGARAELAAVLQLAAAGRLRCSDKTRPPSAATIRTVSEVLGGGDFYEGEPLRAFAWPLLLQAAVSPNCPVVEWSWLRGTARRFGRPLT